MIQKMMKVTVVLLGTMLSFSVYSQMSVDISAPGIKIKKGSNNINTGSRAENIEGGILGDVEIEGVMVLNNEVYIDGIKIPHSTKEYKSTKTGKKYIIERGKNGNISVREF